LLCLAVVQAMPAIGREQFEEIVDPRLPTSPHTMKLLGTFCQVAAACVSPLRKDRPDMAQVLPLLKEIKEKSG